MKTNTATSKACSCAFCTGATCTCGCQTSQNDPRIGCRCGQACACGRDCTCRR